MARYVYFQATIEYNKQNIRDLYQILLSSADQQVGYSPELSIGGGAKSSICNCLIATVRYEKNAPIGTGHWEIFCNISFNLCSLT